MMNNPSTKKELDSSFNKLPQKLGNKNRSLSKSGNKRQNDGMNSYVKNSKYSKIGSPYGDLWRKFDGRQLDNLSDRPNPVTQYSRSSRLFVGNLPPSMTEQELKDIFSKVGEAREIYLSGKSFAFLRMENNGLATIARTILDGTIHKGFSIRVRFAQHAAQIKLSELDPTVSNQMLYQLFSVFGEVQHAEHFCNDKNEATGEGVVMFEKRNSATDAVAAINDYVFSFTKNFKPIKAELATDNEDGGWPERLASKKRNLLDGKLMGPLVAKSNSFEENIGRKWKELYEIEKKRRVAFEAELKAEREKFENEIDFQIQEYEANRIREDIRLRQEQLEKYEASRRERFNRHPNDIGPVGPQISNESFEQVGNFTNRQHYNEPPFNNNSGFNTMQNQMIRPPDNFNEGYFHGGQNFGPPQGFGDNQYRNNQGPPPCNLNASFGPPSGMDHQGSQFRNFMGGPDSFNNPSFPGDQFPNNHSMMFNGPMNGPPMRGPNDRKFTSNQRNLSNKIINLNYVSMN
ncbi:RNA recognition motif domain and Nucleotide-binding, alpha-beta plait domain-containing protein [Strongyloides ratti]|uniref:RNA recognition motif domain and Nucleotide-binding, alpha-beta plait domain-containing protein n=1 Tax=Strongyloides ratti TaxID=34506 RepID=A0A090LE40_STRRB|nr:RNA recognition motif domain and Nucleotide-binding, alpha-beta plait domain-containing protein [Strongyloides ratti]CEF68056.1 RNA recognition motif domain and Nucleotide-binding, alpha-beta plait domain-containing protein [Strongyloides ratti]